MLVHVARLGDAFIQPKVPAYSGAKIRGNYVDPRARSVRRRWRFEHADAPRACPVPYNNDWHPDANPNAIPISDDINHDSRPDGCIQLGDRTDYQWVELLMADAPYANANSGRMGVRLSLLRRADVGQLRHI